MMAPSDIRTTTDKKFEQAKQIYAIAERWHDAIVVLQELCCAIGDRTSSRNSLLEKSSFVKKFVIPLMSDSIVNIRAAAKVLSPVPGIEYVHHRKECKRKQEILFSNSAGLSALGCHSAELSALSCHLSFQRDCIRKLLVDC